MLNEKTEYQALLTNGYEKLLRTDLLCDHLSGIRHALVVLARGFIEKTQECGILSEEWYIFTNEFLKTWFAGNFGKNKYQKNISKYPILFADFEKADANNLKDYINGFDENNKKKFIKNNLKEKHHNNEDPIGTFFEDKMGFFENSIFSKGETNNSNQIFFKDVIAEAIYRGPLKNEVMIIKKQHLLLENNTFDVLRESKPNLFKDIIKAQQKKVLAITAFYLKNRNVGQQLALVCKADIANYLGMSSEEVAKYINRSTIIYKKNERPLFCKVGNTGKFFVDSQWLADFGIGIVDAQTPISEEFAKITDSYLRK